MVATRQTIAAVDLGSNSFHMVVAEVEGEDIQIVDRLRERVQLAAGLDADKCLTAEAQERALACLSRFGERVRTLPRGSVRAVGTNTLRKARNAIGFLEDAEARLGHPVEIISGQEEARLVYLGVSGNQPASEGRRLVVDIGGGSTECILGDGQRILLADSLHMGCVSWSLRFFADGIIDAERMKRAEVAAALELRPIRYRYRDLGWSEAVGTSGTARAIATIVHGAGLSGDGIHPKSLKKLRRLIVAAGHVDDLVLSGLKSERANVLPGGFAILAAVFNSLKVETMQPSPSALREGLLFDLIGRIHHHDVRERSVRTLCERTSVDRRQAERVENTARSLFAQTEKSWSLGQADAESFLSWAARLHEMGMAFSHSGYHKHGAYLLLHADLSGFSRRGKTILSTLVGLHRRKIPTTALDLVPRRDHKLVRRLVVLLRLAVRLNRSRSERPLPEVSIEAVKNQVRLRFPPGWLEDHALTRADLDEEARRLRALGFTLEVA